jgi:hypothetical protein
MLRTLIALASLALLAPAAAAAAPPQAGCQGAFATDPADADDGRIDIRATYFAVAADGSVTANLRVENLVAELPPGRDQVIWSIRFREGNAEREVTARLRSGGRLDYHWSTRDDDGRPRGVTSGALYRGAGGVVSVTVPPEARTSGRLEPVRAGAFTTSGVHEFPTTFGATHTGDEATAPEGSSFIVDGCRASGPSATATPSVRVTRVRARGRRALVRLTVSGELHNVVARLGRTASGRAARLTGTRTIVLTARKRVRRGTYRLALTWDGGSQTTRVRISRGT